MRHRGNSPGRSRSGPRTARLAGFALLLAGAVTAGAQTIDSDSIAPPADVELPPPADFVVCPERASGATASCTGQGEAVCAAIDNGVRCITTPCENIDWRTVDNACEACATAGVIGYRDGSC